MLPEAIEVGASLKPVFECLRLLLAQRARKVGCSVRGLLGEGSVTVRRMRGFLVANEMGRGGVSVAGSAAFANSSAASLPGMPL